MKRIFLASLLAITALCLPARATDLTITPASVVPSSGANRLDTTAGATIAAGQLIYLDLADLDSNGRGKAKLSDADSATAAIRVVDGMAINSASAGQPLSYITYDPALTVGGTQTVNAILILSGTAGGVAPSDDLSEGEYLTVLGVVKSTTAIFFRAPGLISGVAVPP